MDFGRSGTNDLDLDGDLSDMIGSFLSSVVFVSPVSWIGEKLK